MVVMELEEQRKVTPKGIVTWISSTATLSEHDFCLTVFLKELNEDRMRIFLSISISDLELHFLVKL